ncbi:MAG: response regulator, partial [Desulfobacterales bacterium]|nr:response regulator [Desulfobacterales bacterium]
MQNDKSPAPEAKDRVLIVDDDEGMCYTIARMAQEEGHRADHAHT